jgi:hypothetical protein
MELVKQKTYQKTLNLAREQLLMLPLEAHLRKASLSFSTKENLYRISIPVFDDVIDLTVPSFSFVSSRGVNITLTAKIIILHYLITSSGIPLAGEHTPYEDIPGCRAYAPVFDRRVIRPLVTSFGYNREAFTQAGQGAGGIQEDFGNASFTLSALPKVPITFILWEGDEDFPPSVKVLFDRSINTHLPLEDIVVVSKMATTRILKEAKKLNPAVDLA